MKQSKLLIPTLKQDPSDAEAISHQMLLRAGYIRQISAGMYSYLPLAYRVIKNIEDIISEEMDKIDAAEMLMPAVLPAQLWKDSGRYETYGPELFKFKNRHDTDFILGPTHEETFTELIKDNVKSYKKLPLTLYQIQAKYRDENRPRYGLLRGREFIMLDAYSFSSDDESLDEIYRNMESAFQNIFNRIGLDYRTIIGDSGSMGGSDSKEFSAPAVVGEDTIVYSDDSDYAANIEMATNTHINKVPHVDEEELTLIDTPKCKTVEDVSKLLEIESSQIFKSLVYMIDQKPVMVIVRGDQQVNEIKIKNYFNADEVNLATAEEVRKIIGAEFGSIGPISVSDEVKIIADEYIKEIANGFAGANDTGKHYKNVNQKRDFRVDDFGDFHLVQEGDVSPDGSGILKFTRGIEIGHIFKLGTRYSESLKANILDENGREKPIIMGSYGIGVSRLLSAIAEQNADENGLVWPKSISPFDVHVIPANAKNDVQMELANKIYQDLTNSGFKVLFDDRKERTGVKFADSDLIGLPIRITVGKKAEEKIVEVKMRASGETIEAKENEIENTLHILSQNNN
ncbi:proline--tRNA ligase [Lactobacillus sp. S2-2]|uniref:proline--tRNA ligase n=1 Tax=Lactobacillus sp. S2-2 TaxID=2692917 RepID=UPI001F030682|nr:proline--tRNA ligase [Lactobacillus sp. S2-2]MCF6514946.1 proline--tRNA ligase [Lactobacillus sp. S2-2]